MRNGVLSRFGPALAPWTRRAACNALLALARKADVEALLPPGTRRTYQAFARCTAGEVVDDQAERCRASTHP
jgi:uncharacterized protein